MRKWIRKQDINGNWGYYNLETGEFRSTIPNSEEEKQQEQNKRNQAVLKTHSAAKFERTDRRNHSDETIKKKIKIPIVVTDADGNYYNKTFETLAPGEDSAQLNTFWEEQFPLIKGMQLAGGLTKLALSKTGSNSAARWARNSLLNEEFKPIYKGLKSSNPYTGFWDKIIYTDQPEISKDLVTMTKYSVDPNNPQHLNSVIGAWKSRYPETASYIKTPTKEEIADTPYLITGEIPLSDRGLAISKIMENRASRYSNGNEFFVTPGLPITRSVGSYFNVIRNKPTKLYIPLKNDGMGGFYYTGDAAVKMNPWQSKPYTLTQIHEGLSHASDGLVENLKIPIKGVDTPIVSGVTTPVPKTGGAYGRISYPEDIYGKDVLKNVLHKDSEKGIEARAMNWEMISDLYAQLAKEKGITFKEATELPESEFSSFVSTKLKEPSDLSKFMKKFNSQYLTDYANLMEKGTPEQASEYAKRIRSGILTLPAMLPFVKTKE